MPGYRVSVGMECHAELSTASKMFCRCRAEFGGEPNTRVCPVCLGLPGALPVPNEAAVWLAVRAAVALDCTVPHESVFHRKSYFYPDLPKGFQTSQYGETNPIGYGGHLQVPMSTGPKRVQIRRVHLEEDTGKLTHLGAEGSGVDYNRAGIPLLEIVTAFPPDIESAAEAREYAAQLRELLVWIGVCDGRMEQGRFRCEPNVSVRLEGSSAYGTKTELKNLNSLRSVEAGVEHEASRQEGLLRSGGEVRQETRGWDEERGTSYPMRTKEDEDDYRYFVCPDLCPMVFEEAAVERVRAGLPELPLAKRGRYEKELGLSAEAAARLVASREWSEWFDQCVALGGDARAVANWMNGDLARLLNEGGELPVAESKVSPAALVELTQMVAAGIVNGPGAKAALAESFRSGESPSAVVSRLGLAQISDHAAVSAAVAKVVREHAQAADDFRGGKASALGFLVGRVMAETGGRANPAAVQEELRRTLGSG
jgi:aspartyl-tRNA(Asn)/glutamyl-tRNA(Gln) amidotransferase subunit B